MGAIVSLLVIVTVSLLVTRIGAVALSLTGLSPAIARFQARSAFTGVGFTTTESETLVNHPVRRKILMMLMFWGNIGIAAVIASTIASFTDDGNKEPGAMLYRLSILSGGILVLWIIFTSRFVDEVVSRWVESALRTFTNLDVRDYTSLLRLHNGYIVMEKTVKAGDWIGGLSLAEANLTSEGILILGLTSGNGQYIGSPNGKTTLQIGDLLTLYGPEDRLEELDLRKKGHDGDKAHRIAVQVQKDVVLESDQSD